MRAEAERLRLAKAEEKAVKSWGAEKALQEAEQRRKEIEQEKAETERQLKLAEAENDWLHWVKKLLRSPKKTFCTIWSSENGWRD